MEKPNPFNITKAVDLTDQQIMDTWVDLPAAGGFFGLADPKSPMPRLLLGGKGSGRTHLMRYFSFPLQLIRHAADGPMATLEDGYIGIYLRSSGLNSHRFNGKGQTIEVWEAVFSYYMDLWLGQYALDAYEKLARGCDDYEIRSRALAAGVQALFDEFEFPDLLSINEAATLLQSLQKELDLAINNSALTRTLQVPIRVSPGQLVFGIPRAAESSWPELQGVQVLYLIDEFENFGAEQQRYINTLIREREAPSSFFIGSRRYGIKTMLTYSGGEENKEGSEFESLYLDSFYNEKWDQYSRLCRLIVAQRLRDSEFSAEPLESLADRLDQFFETTPPSHLGSTEAALAGHETSEEPRHRRNLRAKLIEALRHRQAPGLTSLGKVEEIIELLRMEDYPLIERASLLLFYRAWHDGKNLYEAGIRIAQEAALAADSHESATSHAAVLEYFKYDLLAQMLRDSSLPQRYLGFDSFVHMSGGLLKNLLVILKFVYVWSSFNDEAPFSTGSISVDAQLRGVRQATEWFFNDATLPGQIGEDARDSVVRLANMLRRFRFSDKPAESSLISFSADLTRCTPRSRETLRAAESVSMLIELDAGQRERNTGRIDSKFQLNPMLCPRWDLPVYRRGTISLTPLEVDAIFDKETASTSYERVVAKRLGRLNAPFSRKAEPQALLPGLIDD